MDSIQMKHMLNAGLCPPLVASMSRSGVPSFKNKLRALVVDDNVVNHRFLIKSLEKFSVETHEAINGKDAVDIFLSGAEFNLVFMDNEMPVMNGPKAIKELRAMGISIKMVGLSSVEREEDIKRFTEAGLDEFFVKPIKLTQLLKLLQEVDKKL